MDERRIPKRVMDMKMSGKRLRDRRGTLWLGQVKRDVERRG
jgi:hypothetical protein